MAKPRIDYEARFAEALWRITKYMTPAQIQRDSARSALGYTEYLEMAYENVKDEARAALHGYRRPRKQAVAKVGRAPEGGDHPNGESAGETKDDLPIASSGAPTPTAGEGEACQFCRQGLERQYLQTGSGIPWHRIQAGSLYRCEDCQCPAKGKAGDNPNCRLHASLPPCEAPGTEKHSETDHAR